MPFDSYSIDPQTGGHVFADSATGQTMLATGPAAEERARQLDYNKPQLVGPSAPGMAALVQRGRADEQARWLASNDGGGGAPSYDNGANGSSSSYVSDASSSAPTPSAGAGGAPGDSGANGAPSAYSGASDDSGGDIPEAGAGGAPDRGTSAQPAPQAPAPDEGKPTLPQNATPAEKSAYRLALEAYQKKQLTGSPGVWMPERRQQTGEQISFVTPISKEAKDDLMLAQGRKLAANQQSSEADDALAKDTLGMQDWTNSAFSAEEAKMRDDYEARMADLDSRREKLVSELENSKVNPSALWESRSTGQAIAASLAVVFGSVGAAMQGRAGENDALRILNAAIDRDIAAQQANIDNKHKSVGVLGKMMADTQALHTDRTQALAQQKVTALEAVKAQAQALALDSGSPQAQAKYGQFAADIALQQAQLRADTERAEAATVQQTIQVKAAGVYGAKAPDVMGAGKTQALIDKDDARGDDGNFSVPMGSTTMRVDGTVSPGELQKIREKATIVAQGRDSLSKLQNYSGKNPFESDAMGIHATNISSGMYQLFGQGQMNGDQEKASNERLARAWDRGGYEAVKEIYDSTVRSIAKTYAPQAGNRQHTRPKGK